MEIESHITVGTMQEILPPYAAHLKSEHKAAGDKHRVTENRKNDERKARNAAAVTSWNEGVEQRADSMEYAASGIKAAFTLERRQSREEYVRRAKREIPHPTREPWDWSGFPKEHEDYAVITQMMKVLECLHAEVNPILGDAEILVVNHAIKHHNGEESNERSDA